MCLPWGKFVCENEEEFSEQAESGAREREIGELEGPARECGRCWIRCV